MQKSKPKPKKKKGSVTIVKPSPAAAPGDGAADLKGEVADLVTDKPKPSFNIGALGFKPCIDGTINLLLSVNEPPTLFAQSGLLSDIYGGAIRQVENNQLTEYLAN